VSSSLILMGAAVVSTICAFAAANLARKQGRSEYLWAGVTFFLPAVLLFLMKHQVVLDRLRLDESKRG